jgi:tetratricopeptide (TPR) repeat protein
MRWLSQVLVSPADAQTPARRRAILLVREAAAAFQRGDMQRTLERAGAATAADSTYPRAYVYRGVALQRLGDRVGARVAYNRVLALAPNGRRCSAYVRNKLQQPGTCRALVTGDVRCAPRGTVRVSVGAANESGVSGRKT